MHDHAGTGLVPGTYLENLGDGKSSRALDMDPKPPEQELSATAPIQDQSPSEKVPITQPENLGDVLARIAREDFSRALYIDAKLPEQELPATAPRQDQSPSDKVPITQEEMPEASPLPSPVLFRLKTSPSPRSYSMPPSDDSQVATMGASRGLDPLTGSGLASSQKTYALPDTKSEFDREEEERLGLEMRFHDVHPSEGWEILSHPRWLGGQESREKDGVSRGEDGAGSVGMDLQQNSVGELEVVGLVEGRPAERSFVHLCIYLSKCVYMCICVHLVPACDTYIHTYIHIYIHTYIHTYVCIYIYIYI